jgi:ABC-type multidrug transport system ATPase subunit
MTANAIELTGLTKSFRRQIALDGLDLSIPRGSIFGLVGKNGAGKTTTLSILAGLLQPDSGRIDLLGDGPFVSDKHKGRITLLPQDAQLPGHARVEGTLMYLARLQGLSVVDAKRHVHAVLDWVELSHRADSLIRTLSHGMIRRLTIAQAFLGSPELVLLDEPTSGLDPQQVVHFRNMIMSLRGRQTIVISSHILSEIETACDRVAFIDNGKTIQQASLNDILGRSRTLTYHLGGNQLPLAQLRNSLPNVTFNQSSDGTTLTVNFENTSTTHAEINADILRILLDLQIPIFEVRIGSNLEQEFLRQI